MLPVWTLALCLLSKAWELLTSNDRLMVAYEEWAPVEVLGLERREKIKCKAAS